MKAFFLFFASICSINFSFSQGTNVVYMDGKVRLTGYFVKAKNAKSKAPGIVIIHAWMGLDEHSQHSADQLAQLGYNALAADIYGDNAKPKDRQEAAKLSNYYKSNPDVYQSRINAAIQELVKQGANPDKIVVIGYCFGGTGALEAARGGLPVAGVVSFHGGLGKDSLRTNKPIAAKVLILHGADDPYVSKSDIESFQKEMRDGKADWQMIYYGNAVHAFTEIGAGTDNSKGAAYNEKAAKRSWEDMKVFLKEVFE